MVDLSVLLTAATEESRSTLMESVSDRLLRNLHMSILQEVVVFLLTQRSKYKACCWISAVLQHPHVAVHIHQTPETCVDVLSWRS